MWFGIDRAAFLSADLHVVYYRTVCDVAENEIFYCDTWIKRRI